MLFCQRFLLDGPLPYEYAYDKLRSRNGEEK